jgi:hypothetical protein
MGLYWDDWPSLWFLHFWGPKIFPLAFSIDRPVQGWLFVLTTTIFGESLFGWQIFGIIARWLSGIALGWMLLSLWPRRRFQVLGVTILFLVYPGFLSQNIAITYGHQFLIMGLFLVSFGTMIWSIRRPARYLLFTGLSMLIALLSMFALEYYFGLELLRPVFLWIVIGETVRDRKSRLIETGKRWLPYLGLDAIFLAWRLTTDPATTITRLAQTIANDIYESAALAWGRIFIYLNFEGVKSSVLLAYILTVLAAGLLSIALLLIVRSNGPTELKTRRWLWGLSAALIGFYALMIGGWPFWVTDLRLELTIPWDRFTQPMMLGACLMLVGLIDLLIRLRLLKVLLIGILAGLAAGSHFYQALNFRQEWVEQRTFLWQLAWRAPALEPGTVILTTGMPFSSSTDNSLTAAINWIYAPALEEFKMPFLMYDTDARLGNRLPSLEPDIPLDQDYRATHFEGSTSQALVLYYNPPRCLKVFDLVIDRHYPNKPGMIVLALPLSRLELINEAEAGDPAMPGFLGPELKHNWCYYFEKVDLAVQLGKWGKAADLADEALRIKPKLTEDNAPELIPFIYAFAHAKRYDKALSLSLEAGDLSNKMHYYTCDTWYYLDRDIDGDAAFDAALAEINQKFECTPP